MIHNVIRFMMNDKIEEPRKQWILRQTLKFHKNTGFYKKRQIYRG